MLATSVRVGLVDFREQHDTRTNGQHYTAAYCRPINQVSVWQAEQVSRPTRPTRVTSSRGCRRLVTRLPDWSAGGLLRCIVCRVVLQIPRTRHARLVADKSLASSSDTSDTPDFLVSARMSRGYYEETAAVEFQLYRAAKTTSADTHVATLVIIANDDLIASRNLSFSVTLS